MSQPEVIWKPMPGSQTEFLKTQTYEVLLEGTRGGGKTDALLMSFAQYVGRGYGSAWTGIIFRLTYPQLQDIIAKSKRWFYQIFPDATYNESDHVWVFSGGERLFFRFGETADDYWNYHGHEYPFLGFEELTNWKNSEFFESMLSCCRSSHPNMPRLVRSTTNPYGVGHNWVKQRYRIGSIEQNKAFTINGGKPRKYIHSSLKENSHLLENDPEYLKTLSSIEDPTRRKAWLEGSWDIFAGSFLEGVWDAKRHVVEPFVIPSSWKVWKSMDWGYRAPYAVLWLALDNDGCIYVWRELYGAGVKEGMGVMQNAGDVAERIKEMEKHDKRFGYEYRMNLADPAIFSKLGTDRSIGQIFRDHDVRWIEAWNARGSRINGAQEIIRLLAEDKLKFFNTCKHCLRTIPALPPDEDNPEDVDTTMEDHCFPADTLVMTDKGIRRIDSIGDAKVLNRDGRFVSWENWRFIRNDAETVRVTFSDGSSVVCTPDHEFLCGNEWIEAKDLLGKEVKQWKLKSSLTSVSGSMGKTIISAVTTSRKTDSDCTVMSGHFILGKSPKDTTSTTLTATNRTMTSRILNAFSEAHMSARIQESRSMKRLLLSLARRLKNGTGLTQDINGIKSIINVFLSVYMHVLTSPVRYVENFLKALIGRNTAEMSVNPERSAGRILVTSVEKEKNSDVGCITVPDTHSFCLANGVVVSNCWDALRYGVMRKRRSPDAVGIEEKSAYATLLDNNNLSLRVTYGSNDDGGR